MDKKRKKKEMESGAVKKKNGRGGSIGNIIALVTGALIGIIVALAVFKFILITAVATGADMEGTISSGDRILGTRLDVEEEEIERYDILFFTPSDNPEKLCLKRVIGLPGETIEIRDGEVYADGRLLDDSFVKYPMNRRGDGIYTIPEGCYFFLGDNRNNSYDSRFWDEKFVPLDNIKAKARMAGTSFFDMRWL